MRRRLLLLLLCLPLAGMADRTLIPVTKGDLDGDGKVTIHDLTLLIQALARPLLPPPDCDVNTDGRYNTADVEAMVALILQPTATTPQHEAVDLGLSMRWATCNLGATQPWQPGHYYAWGELQPKEDYSEESYAYCDGGEYRNIGANICGTKYDAAREAWGEQWRMPTLIDINQLLTKCTWTETTLHGTSGYTVTGPNGNSIFLPKAGKQWGTQPTEQGTRLYYWCGMSQSATATSAYVLNDTGYTGNWSAIRSYGFAIRPVCSK